MRLDVALVVARRAERVLENPVGASKRCRPLAIGSDLHDQVPLDVRMRDGWPRSTEIDVVFGIRMENGGAVGERVLDVQDRRKLLVLHLHELRGFLRRLACVRGDSRHAVADEPNPVARQHRPVLNATSETRPRRQVGASEHRADAGHSPGPGGVDRLDQRVRIRTTHIDRVQHAGLLHVGGIAGMARHLQMTFGAILGIAKRLQRQPLAHDSAAAAARTLSTIW